MQNKYIPGLVFEKEVKIKNKQFLTVLTHDLLFIMMISKKVMTYISL